MGTPESWLPRLAPALIHLTLPMHEVVSTLLQVYMQVCWRCMYVHVALEQQHEVDALQRCLKDC